ncbi:MAG: hypothetical protein V4440_08485, partial [Pseudomonadota bacterium]
VKTKSPVTLDRVYVADFQKEGTKTAQIRQSVTTISSYPSKKVVSDKQAGIFDLEEFGFESQDFTATEQRVAWIPVPANATANFPLSLPDNYIDVLFASVTLVNATYLGYALNAIGRPLADNDAGYWPNINGLTFDPDGKISCVSAMTSPFWVQKVDGTMQFYTVRINSGGQVSLNSIDSSSFFMIMM